jgi:hypothetical protein
LQQGPVHDVVQGACLIDGVFVCVCLYV